MKKIILFISILICAIVSLWYTVYIKDNTSLNITEFSKEKWQDTPYERVYIVEDLCKKHRLKDMNKDEILDLLGENHCVITDNSITYTLGKKMEDLFFSYFRIDFNEINEVINISVYQD